MRMNAIMLALLASMAIAADAGTPPPVIQWSQQFPGGAYDWFAATAYAANLVEAGHSDWRLATRAEWQAAIANIPNVPLGPFQPNIPANNTFWTADQQGQRAWMVYIATDANGYVIQNLSGATIRQLKGSYTYAAAARP